MRAVVVLLACAVVQALAAQSETPCFPPGSCTNFAPAAMTLPAAVAAGAAITSVTSGGPQVVLQSNAVDVETDGGFVISLPTPPPPSPDLPEFVEDHGANSAVNKVIAHQRNKIALLEAKMAQKKQALADHDTWLEQAKRAIERVKKQIRETTASRAAINRNLKHLSENRKSELQATKRAKVAKELEETRKKLAILAEQHASVARAKAIISRKRARVSKAALGYGKLLNWHNDQLKAKIQQFEDEEDDLGHIGQTPQNIRHIDTLLQNDEEVRMAEI